MEKLQKGKRGITLIALVVTIVVLLILAGVSISMLTGENGILTQANNSRVETRGASVQEARDLWKMNEETDRLAGTTTAQSLEELLADLLQQNLLTNDEVQEVKETGEVTIGTRTIIFKETPKLVGKIIYRDYGVYIEVNYKKNNYEEFAEKILEGKTPDEIEQIYVEGYNYKNKIYDWGEPEFKDMNEYIKYYGYTIDNYQDIWESEGCDSLKELAIRDRFVELVKYETEYQILGNITSPDGTVTGVNSEISAQYEITQDGSYTFTGLTLDGQKGSVTITAQMENKYQLVYFGGTEFIHLMKGYELIDVTQEMLPKMIYSGETEEIDLSSNIRIGNYKNVYAIKLPWDGYDGEHGSAYDAKVWCTIDGEKIEWEGYVCFLV